VGDRTALARLAGEPDLRDVLVEHSLRGLRIQLWVRPVLVAFVILVVTLEPPVRHDTSCIVVVGCYAAWAVGVAIVTRRGGEIAARYAWLALFGDLFALVLLSVLSGYSVVESWTAYILINGLVLIPVLAATQLRPLVCAAVAGPTVILYFVASVTARKANAEPWASVNLRTLVIAGLAVGCVLLSRVQRGRVVTIGGLATQRAHLLAETMQIEERERRELAEHLHDGALQYLLAARQDLEDVRESAEALDRVEHALAEASRLLRSTMTELHPAVLRQAGLPSALNEIAETIGARARLEMALDTGGWRRDPDARIDALLFAAARELLTNVARHAEATRVMIAIRSDAGRAILEITDDGRGIAAGALARRLAEGHVGLASQQARIAAVGGRLTLEPAYPRGTLARVELPLEER
jgi:two-component system NarL family sensor kinase